MTADIGDLVIYMGHVGIVLDRNPKHPNHLEVWFIEMATSIVIYAPLLAKYKKNLTTKTKQDSGQYNPNQ